MAENFRDKINFATIDAKTYGFFAEALGLRTGQFPALVVEDVMSGDTMPFYDEITAPAVANFLDRYFSAGDPTQATSKVPTLLKVCKVCSANFVWQDENHDEL